MIYLQLFLSYLKIGFFGFGGGYAMLALIQNEVVVRHAWMTNTEFTDIVAVSQMTPGPIAINSATFVGIRIGGVGGALVSTLGCILPSLIIVMTLAYFYTKYKNIAVIQGVLSGLRPAVVALIASAGLSIVILAFWGEGGFSLKPADLNLAAVGLFAAGLFVLRKWKPNPIWVMLGSGVAGLCLYTWL